MSAWNALAGGYAVETVEMCEIETQSLTTGTDVEARAIADPEVGYKCHPTTII
jgi:hypothetical protein